MPCTSGHHVAGLRGHREALWRLVNVYTDLVRSGLAELADVRVQQRLWCGRGAPGEMSSFEEAVARVFDDSGLDLALDKGEVVFSGPVDGQLRDLGSLVATVELSKSPEVIIAADSMEVVRHRAARILECLQADAQN